MINEAYCSYEVSKLLKEKGFRERICSYYKKGHKNPMYTTQFPSNWNEEMLHQDCISAPTHQMACAWLREKHHIHANPIRQGNYNDCSDYYTWIVASNGTIYRNQSVADKLSYEEAIEEALKYVLENLL